MIILFFSVYFFLGIEGLYGGYCFAYDFDP